LYNERFSVSVVAVLTRFLKLPIFLVLAEGNPRLSQRPARKYDGRQKWRLRRPELQSSWPNRHAGNRQLKMLLLRCECEVELEYYHFIVEVWWCCNVHFTVEVWCRWKLSLYGGSVVVLECYHFTVEVLWRWNVITSQ